MKFRFFSLKKKTIIIFLLCVLCSVAIFSTYFSLKSTFSPKYVYSIVIDAGHGGRDGGAEGATTGVKESDLNLEYAQILKEFCEDFGFRVVMTRSGSGGLYDENASNKKKSEMAKRREIINNSGADIMISIHMNSFQLSSCKGAQVFYGSEKAEDKPLASSIASSLSESFSSARSYSSAGDYFVLNCSLIPSALVECGFLSNPEEEVLLQDKDYQEKFCYSLLAGINSYFSVK